VRPNIGSPSSSAAAAPVLSEAGQSPSRRLNVFITIDTEFSPRDFHAGNGGTKALVDRDIDGVTAAGNFGIGFQMDRLEAHGLRAVFQVESLSASAVGSDVLRRVVDEVQGRGHEVQMHVHAEWLDAINGQGLPPFRGRNLVSYSEEEQTQILECGLRNIREAGARDVSAFRAGNYGANRDTLKAVARNGLRYDTSYNVCYLDPSWPSRDAGLMTQPAILEGVYEVPISFFSDFPGHMRPAQLCACSSRELEYALTQAWKAGWQSFVIVSHSFELIRRPRDPRGPVLPDRLVIDRMESLCRFLGANQDKFRSAVFADLDQADLPPSRGTTAPIRSKIGHTVVRMAEQLFGRMTS
jgi:hypothetical protein